MRPASRMLRQELKRLSASFDQLKPEEDVNKSKKQPNLKTCLKCKQDAGKNFFLVYKRDNTLNGKVCKSCHDKPLKKAGTLSTLAFTRESVVDAPTDIQNPEAPRPH